MKELPPGMGHHHIGPFQLGLLAFTILVLIGSVVDTASTLPKEVSNLVHMVDTFACAVFFGDFCFRFYKAESKLKFMKWGWIDLIACIPNLEIFRWGRLVRVLRIIRLLRAVRSVQLVMQAVFRDKLRGGVWALAFSALLLVAFSSASVLCCENSPESNIKTAEDALWWSVTTITTVGYGDKFPVTTEGRVIGFVLMVAGVSMFGCMSGLAASFFLGASEKNTAESKEILDRLDRLQAKLDELSLPQRDSRRMGEELKL